MSKIEWTDRTWNPVVGCTKVSAGCKNCYAERMAARLAGIWGSDIRKQAFNKYEKVITKSKWVAYGNPEPRRWNGKTYFDKSSLEKPLHWRKPRKIFVCSMGDLFHESVPFEWIDKIYDVILSCPQHTFQLLTKRPDRALEYYKSVEASSAECGEPMLIDRASNIWFGWTAENQDELDKRIPIGLQIPAAVRFVSCEPLLGPIDFHQRLDKLYGWIDWVIVGQENGSGARPCKMEWIKAIFHQCRATGTPCFVKKPDIGLREFPNVQGSIN